MYFVNIYYDPFSHLTVFDILQAVVGEPRRLIQVELISHYALKYLVVSQKSVKLVCGHVLARGFRLYMGLYIAPYLNIPGTTIQR
jgi:hypothetical protein